MPITIIPIANVGSPPDDPLLALPGQLYVPDGAVHPQPWPCVVGTQASEFRNSEGLRGLRAPFTDLANAGFLCLAQYVRLTTAIPGQTTTGRWHQQTDDLKIGIRKMRSNPFALGYAVTGFVGTLGGSGSAHHSLYAAIDGTKDDDKSDAAICLSPPTDFSDRQADVSPKVIGAVTTYGNSTDLGVLLSESPVALAGLASASPIYERNGDHETMALSMKTLLDAAIAFAGTQGYTSILNTGTLGTLHSFAQWVYISADAIAWLQARANEWRPGLSPPIFTPPSGTARNESVTISCPDAGAHIFYNMGSHPVDPTHDADIATGGSVRIGTNSGVVNTGPGIVKIRAIAYKAGALDSVVNRSGVYGSALDIGLGAIYLPPSYQTEPPPSVNQPGLTNPYMQGILWRGGWANLDPDGSGPVFTWLDLAVLTAEINSKLSALEFLAGLGSPAWFFALPGVQILNLTDHGPTTVPWDPIFQTHWEAFNVALAARYDGRIGYIKMAGVGRASESFIVRDDHPEDQALADTLAQAHGYADAITAWKAGVTWLIDMYARVWLKTPFVLCTGQPFPIGGFDALKAMFDYGNNTYRGRFGSRSDDLTFQAPIATDLGAIVIGETSPYCIASGYQEGSSQNDTDPSPPTNLGLAIARALGFGAHFIEFFLTDADDPVSVPVITAIPWGSDPGPPPTLSTPIFNPNQSDQLSVPVTISCVDGGAHLFYTIGANPADPTHIGDTPTGGTLRIGAAIGVVNSGPGVSRIKALAYESGFQDSAIGESGVYGQAVPPPPPPPPPVPVPIGFPERFSPAQLSLIDGDDESISDLIW